VHNDVAALHHLFWPHVRVGSTREAKNAVAIAKDEVAAAVHGVIKGAPATRRLLLDFIAAEQRYVDLRQSVRNIPLGFVCPDDLKDNFGCGRAEQQPDYTGAKAWAGAIKGLEIDPDTPLPMT
jgi:hypothetical protein